ncbi:MAG TPA: DUF4381 family protein [Gammaproteobacteria bacterium]|nr:DUF4381 family protein [Gammaproteobacteria bacterium]
MPAPIDPAQLPLRDIHLPPPPSWWPPAPGWWLLGLLLVGLPAALLLGRHLRRRGALRRRALGELASLRARGGPPGLVAAEAALLLRRVSLALDPARRHVAATGSAWLARVRSIAPGFEDAALAELLLRAPYAAQTELDASALLAALERWIRALPRSPRRLRELAAAPPAGGAS